MGWFNNRNSQLRYTNQEINMNCGSLDFIGNFKMEIISTLYIHIYTQWQIEIPNKMY